MDVDPPLCPVCRRNLSNGEDFDGIARMPDLDVYQHNLIARREEIESMKLAEDPLGQALESFSWLVSNRTCLSKFRSVKYAEVWVRALEELRA
jgi:hypothetical protein